MKCNHPWLVANTLVVSGTRHYGPGERASLGTPTEGLHFAICPCDMEIGGITVVYGAGGPGAGTSLTFVIRKSTDDGASWSSSAVSETLSDTNTTVNGTTSDTFGEGDRVALRLTVSGSPTGRSCMIAVWVRATGQPTWQPILFCSAGNSADAAATEYHAAFGKGNFVSTTESTIDSRYPTPGTVSRLAFGLSQAPGAGDSWIGTLRHNGASTSCPTVTVSGASDTQGIDTSTSPLAVARADRVCVEVVPVVAPAGSSRVGGGWVFIPDTPGYAIGGLSTVNPSTVSSSTQMIVGAGATTSLTNDVALAATPVTARDLYFEASVAPGAGNSWTLTFYENAGATALADTISDGSDTVGENTADTVDSVQGDTVAVRIAPASGPSAAVIQSSFVFVVPSDEGHPAMRRLGLVRWCRPVEVGREGVLVA